VRTTTLSQIFRAPIAWTSSKPLMEGGYRFGQSRCLRRPTVQASYSQDFGPFDGRIWLNAAHQGPLPRRAAQRAEEAITLKVAPHRIADEAFVDVPRQLRELLGRLVGAPATEIVLGNSASWGLQVLANGMPWREGDEIVVLADEFPATIFPWLVAERRGAEVRQLELDRPVLDAARLERELTPRTRVVCVNWVRSLTGHVVDLTALGHVCADAGVHLVVNATQGLGALPLSVSGTPLAASTSSGFKWLCGPYATGFAWIRPDLLETLEPTQAYWLALPDGVALDLNREGEHRLRNDLGARAFDVFGTANFLNFVPWAAAVEYLLEQGLEAVAEHDQALVDRLLAGLDGGDLRVISPTEPGKRAAIVTVASADAGRNVEIHGRLSAAGIDVALRGGNLRLSPHLYNTPAEIDRALDVMLG
jgi:cysteine desulfurase/selenocysteine lyase